MFVACSYDADTGLRTVIKSDSVSYERSAPYVGPVRVPVSEPLYINRHDWVGVGNSSRLGGRVDDVAIFDRVLTLEEIEAVRTTGRLTEGPSPSSVLLEDGWESGSIDTARWTAIGSPSPFVASGGLRGRLRARPQWQQLVRFGCDVHGFVPDEGARRLLEAEAGGVRHPPPRLEDRGCWLRDTSQGPARVSTRSTLITTYELNGFTRLLYMSTVDGHIPAVAHNSSAWHTYRIKVRDDGHAEFYRDGVRIGVSAAALDLDKYPSVKLQIRGRSQSQPTLIDDVVVRGHAAPRMADEETATAMGDQVSERDQASESSADPAAGSAEASDGELDTRVAPEGYERRRAVADSEASELRGAAGSPVRLYRNYLPWWAESRVAATLDSLGLIRGADWISSSMDSLWTEVPLGARLVWLTSASEGDWLGQISQQRAGLTQMALRDFVEAGGVLVVSLADNSLGDGYRVPGMRAAPDLVTPDACREFRLTDASLGADGAIGTEDDHDFVRGADGESATRDDLRPARLRLSAEGCAVAHGHLEGGAGLPDNATVLATARFDGRQRAILAEYPLGAGRVIVTTMTLEHSIHPPVGSGPSRLLGGLASYAARLAGIELPVTVPPEDH